MDPGTKNFTLENTCAYLLTISTYTDAGCVVLTGFAGEIVWKITTPLPSGVNLARSGLTLGITTAEIAVIALQKL